MQQTLSKSAPNYPVNLAINLPQFSKIHIADIDEQLDSVLAKNRLIWQELAQQTQPTWLSFALPIQTMDVALDDFWSPIGHLNGVANSDELREVFQRSVAKLTEYGSEMGQSALLYGCYKKLADSSEFNEYSPAQQQWVKKALLDFHLSGVDLPEQQKSRFKEISARLADLAQTFSNHILDATAAWQKNILDVNELKGLPQSALAMLEQAAQKKDKKGYLITLDFPVYHAIITYAENRELRKECYLAYMSKASEQDANHKEFDNSAIMVETLALKQELATLLGFANYAERSLATKMAKSVDEVVNFLQDLAQQCKPFALQEVALLNQFAKETFALEQLQAWDFSFISEQYRQSHFSLSDELLREYFPLEKVLSGLFTIVEKIFAVTILQTNDFDNYHPDVRLYTIEKDEKHIASFYLDLFARDKKRGGAWMANCRSRWQDKDNKLQIPVAFLTCNFRPAAQDQPALLGHSEVVTLFHEFGHGLHHMLTTQNIVGISGISGVEWDAVELPSQFMENWCWQKESIQLLSAHYKTAEALPEQLLNSMLAAKNFNAGIMMMRQLEFALFDMQIHSQKSIADADKIQLILDEVRKDVAVIIPPAEVRFQHSFSHIFAGGYAAGYYSYKWAEILSADAFSVFVEKGIFDAESGKLFLDNILAVGSSRSAAESFYAFRGRAPDANALLEQCGLTAETTTITTAP